ncbi:MAG TPA: TaqI-like C-terminal specificity domain-containing protein, partial [Allocoleopsis sp.]
AYLEKFTEPKIIFSEIVSEPQFYYDEDGYYPEATVFFISGNNLKYLTGLLNSNPVTFFFKTFYMGGELVGKIRYKKAFLEQVPLPIPTSIIENKISNLVTDILSLKKSNPQTDTSELEREIDVLVYELYGLTEEEITIIEGENS